MNSLRKAKLLWHCRRGMLELDLILLRFAENNLDSMTEAQIDAFEELLSCIDPELYNWLMGYSTPTDKELVEIVEFITAKDSAR
ncbi:succinate dehydrogenase assembly factor 2 [Legionella massiliensis]|uniref:FAD assembly factor SdhE n=1 Tax=Legionella massiliensis TaxID=1034943 RepID=UPI00159ED2A6